MSGLRSVRVLVVDDSALVRQLLTEILGRSPGMEVVGAAGDPYAAWEQIPRVRPDVLTLDVEMPRMDGLTFLEKLMRLHPLPVVMISSLTERGATTTLRALELGAVDFITKPRVDITTGTVEQAADIVEKVRAAAAARPRAAARRTASAGTASAGSPAAAPEPSRRPPRAGVAYAATHKVIAVGTSTGGTEALREFLGALPADAPGIVVVQHMPAGFTRQFAARLDGLCAIRVREAADGDRVLPGHALIAPGGRHLTVVRSGAAYGVRVTDGELVNRHRPSVDVLFDSCAEALGANAVGVIMTGMGNDGARGLLAMRRAGARTVAQDERSCVVFGMPREALALGAVEDAYPLEALAETALRLAR